MRIDPLNLDNLSLVIQSVNPPSLSVLIVCQFPNKHSEL